VQSADPDARSEPSQLNVQQQECHKNKTYNLKSCLARESEDNNLDIQEQGFPPESKCPHT